MKLNEKIYWCRKHAALSQEELAARIGVSRQSISKWETGEASPEISKLPLLAQAFGVTTDWLLSEDGIPEEAPAAGPAEQPRASSSSWPQWVEDMPGFISRAIKKYGWLYGVRMAAGGGLFALFGVFMRVLTSAFIRGGSSGFDAGFGSGGVTWYDAAGNITSAPYNADEVLSAIGMGSGSIGTGFDSITSTADNMFGMMSGFVIFIGLMILAVGIVLAVLLRRWGQRSA